MNIQDYYKYSQLSALSYVDWEASAVGSGSDFRIAVANANAADRIPGNNDDTDINTLGEMIFAPTSRGGQGWQVADFHTNEDARFPNDNKGFKASLFTNSATGEKVLAICGTEPGLNSQGLADLLRADLQEIGDYGMAISQAVSLFNYVQCLQAPKDSANVLQLELRESIYVPPSGAYVTVGLTPPRYLSVVASQAGTGLGLLDSADNVTITGHSLGGHLAAIGQRLFPNLFDSTVTFNAPGFDPLVGIITFPGNGVGLVSIGEQATDEFVSTLFEPHLNSPPLTDFGNINVMVSENLSPDNDSSFVSSLITGTQPGPQQAVATERNSHMIEPFMDSLAVQALLERLNPDIGLAGAGALMGAASNKPGKSEEIILDALSVLLINNQTTKLANDPNDIADGIDFWISSGDFLKRTAIHNRIIELETAISGKNLTLTSLVDMTASELHATALAENTTGLAYRYALRNLNPFVLTGDASLYNPGELALYNPDTGQGVLSDEWIKSRSDFLYWKLQIATADADAFEVNPYTGDGIPEVAFLDAESNQSIYLGEPAVGWNSNRQQVFFGGAGNDRSTSYFKDDRIYGGAGNDSLSGGIGTDYLEGGADNDTLIGGEGDDTLHGGTGFDTYIINAGDGDDTIMETREADGQKHGVIKYVSSGQTHVINGRFKKDGDNSNTYLSEDGFTLTRGTTWQLLVPTGEKIDLGNDFVSGDFGIQLEDKPTLGSAPPTDLTIRGDLSPVDANPNSQEIDYLYDSLGNVITNPAAEESGRDDALFAGVGNDLLQGMAGNDRLDASNGGENRLIGGTGQDILLGGDDTDLLFADAEVRVEEALIDGVPTGLRGDYLDGGDSDDQLVGSDGDDLLLGAGGNDLLIGGAGDDTIRGDMVCSYVKSDWYVVRRNLDTYNFYTEYHNFDMGEVPDLQAGDDTIYAGSGDDWANGGYGADWLDGGAGNDVLFGQAGADVIFGGAEDDVIVGDSTSTPVEQQGNDYLDGESGNDYISGNGGDDILYGGDGADTLKGGSGEDALVGEGGDDLLEGQEDDDILSGGLGNDLLSGGTGDDALYGDEGVDELRGNEDNDVLEGGAGNDLLWGGEGHDTLRGDEGTDELYGNEGDDTLHGGLDADYLAGGTGNDVYQFNRDDSFWASGPVDSIDDLEGENVISFGSGIELADITTTFWDNNGLLVDYGSNDRLHIAGGQQGAVVYFQLANGYSYDLQELLAKTCISSMETTSTTPDDSLQGGLADDTLTATGGGSTLNGGQGDDTLIGAGGNNTYLYSAGDGTDLIVDVGAQTDSEGNPAPNRLIFGSGIRSEDLTLSLGSLRIQVGPNPDDVIRIDNFNPDDVYAQRAIDLFEFADGTVLTYDQLLERGFDIEGGAGDDTLFGTNIHDRILGGAGNDTINGGIGDDILQGGDGNDTYVFSRASGQVIVEDGAENSNLSYDRIQFADGITPDDLHLVYDGQNIQVSVDNAPGSLILKNWMESTSSNQIEMFQFDSAPSWNQADIVAATQFSADAPGPDLPEIQTVNVSGAEDADGGIALSLSVEATGFGEVIEEIMISGVPDGATLGFGTDYGSGVWGVSPQWVDQLILNPPANYSGTIDLSISATTARIDGKSATDSKSLVVTVDPVADSAIVRAHTVIGSSETLLPLEIEIQPTDPSEQIGDILLKQIPSEVTLTAGYLQTNGDWLLSAADLQNLHLVFPEDWAGNFALDIEAESVEENGDNRWTATKVPIVKNPVATVPLAENGTATQGTNGDDVIVGNEQANTLLGYNGDDLLIGGDGDDNIFANHGNDLQIGGNGNDRYSFVHSFYARNTDVINDNAQDLFSSKADYISIPWTYRVNDYSFKRSGNNLTMKENYFESKAVFENWFSDERSRVELLMHLVGPEDLTSPLEGQWTWTPIADLVSEADWNQAADPLNVRVKSVSGADDIVLPLTIEVEKFDPNETIESIYIQGLPEGFSLSNGQDLGSGRWSVDTSDLEGLALTPSSDWTGSVNLEVEATSLDSSGRRATLARTFNVLVEKQATAPLLSVEDWIECKSGETVSVNIDVQLVDLDESLTPVVIDGVPDGVTLSAGTNNLDGSWSLDVADLTGLTMMVPENIREQDSWFELNVSVGSMETDGQTVYSESSLYMEIDTSVQGTDGDDLLIGSSYEDYLEGYDGNDILIGGEGEDGLSGGTGDDTYVYNIGDGFDYIEDEPSGIDTIKFGPGIQLSDLSGYYYYDEQWSYGYYDIYTPDDGGISVGDWESIEFFQFDDGSVYTYRQLLATLGLVDNSAPTISSTVDLGSMLEDDSLQITSAALLANATDADGDPLSIKDLTVDSGTLIDNGNGSWTYQPDADVNGPVNFNYSVSDSIESTSTTVPLEIVAVNDAPVVSIPLADQSATQGSAFSYQVPAGSFSDPDQGDSINYSASLGDGSALPSWLNFDATTVSFNGMPASGDVGTLNVKVTATDTGSLVVSDHFNLNIDSISEPSVVDGTDSNDKLFGSAENDILSGYAGQDSLYGNSGDDILYGGIGNDKLFGQNGHDSAYGSDGDDVLRGGSGNDDLYGENNNDALYGGKGSDRLYGGSGNDQLSGGKGADKLYGNGGKDTLAGGVGNDKLFGGGGNDVYLVEPGGGKDTIKDSGGNDSLRFGSDISVNDIAIFKSSNNLQVEYGSGNMATINNFFKASKFEIENIELASGEFLTAADINQIVQDMAAYAVTEGISLASVGDIRQHEPLMAMVANSWHQA